MKREVKKSTEAGVNCATCLWIGVDLEYTDHQDVPFLFCANDPTSIEWNKEGHPRIGTSHPPGDSVCSEWERISDE